MTSLFPPFTRRQAFRKLPFFYEAGRGPYIRSQGGPSLDLNFANMSSINDLTSRGVTFSRASNATYYDSTGKLTYAPNNMATRSNDPSSLTNPGWQNGGAQPPTITAGGFDDPFGGTTASRLVPGGLDSPLANKTGVSFAGRVVIGSIWLRTASGTVSTSIRLSSEGIRYVGTQAVTVTTTWQRFFVRATGLSTDTGGINFDFGAGTTGTIFFYGAQVEAVTYQTTPGPYVATTSAAFYGPRFDYDPVTLQPKGLLIEEARTNLALYSQTFSNAAWQTFAGAAKVGAAPIAAPDGTLTAYEVSFGSTGGAIGSASAIYQNIASFAASTTYTQSLFVRAKSGTTTVRLALTDASATTGSADLTVTDTAWTRITLTAATTTASGPNISIRNNVAGNSANVYVWGFQAEAGSFATSYIPTAANSVQRVADSASMTGAAFSSWYNQSEGTFVADGAVEGSANTPAIMGVDDGTASNRIVLRNDVLAPVIRYVSSSGNYSATGGSWPVNIFNKLAFAYKASDQGAAFAGNGISVTSQSAVPVVTQLQIGTGNTSNVWNGWIKSLTYYRQRLSNAQLQLLTAPNLAAALALDLDFTTGVLDPRVTFSRTSGATFVDSTGSVTWAPENLLLQSSALTTSPWATFGTVTTGQIDPFGGTTAIRLVASAGSGAYRQSLSGVAPGNYLFSFYAKGVTSNKIKPSVFNASLGVTVAGNVEISVSTTDYQRVTIPFTWSSGTTALIDLTRDPTSAVDALIAAPQLERVTYQTSPRTYNATTAAAYYGPRFTYDPASLQPLGLLIEEARTNLCLQSTFASGWTASSATLTANAAASPDGTNNAASVAFNASATAEISQNQTLTAATYTVSVWARSASGNQSFRFKYFNGTTSTFSADQTATTIWQRFTFQFTGVATAGNIALTNGTDAVARTVQFFGAQLELGSFATSYIPTTTGSVARSADSASITGSNFSSWYKDSQGVTGVAVFQKAQATPYNFAQSTAFDAQSIGYINNPGGSSSRVNVVFKTPSTYQESIAFGTSSLAPTDIVKAAFAWSGATMSNVVNGAVIASNLSRTVPTGMAALLIGTNSYTPSSASHSGTISRLTYYNVRASDTQLQGLTI